MKTRLLKITNMKRFCWWLDMNNVPSSDIDYAGSKYAFWKETEKIFDRADKSTSRNSFVWGRKRGVLKGVIARWEMGIASEKLLNYIKKRYERKKAKRTNS